MVRKVNINSLNYFLLSADINLRHMRISIEEKNAIFLSSVSFTFIWFMLMISFSIFVRRNFRKENQQFWNRFISKEIWNMYIKLLNLIVREWMNEFLMCKFENLISCLKAPKLAIKFWYFFNVDPMSLCSFFRVRK